MTETTGVKAMDSVKVGEIAPYILANVKMQLESARTGRFVSVIWIAGAPGIGKSWKMADICQTNGYGLGVQYMGTMLLEQITGLPKALAANDESDETKWTKPQMFCLNNLLVKPKDPGAPTILFLDDAHQCNKSIQSYMFQLLTYRGIHQHKLPSNVAIVMAGNRASDKAGFQQILAPVTNRLFFLDVECDVDDWTENFAIRNGVRIDIVSFLQNFQSYLQSAPLESSPWASPRSWTYASDMLTMFEDTYGEPDIPTLTKIVGGHVGTEYAAKFVEYKKLMMDWRAGDILTKKKAVPNIQNLDAIKCYALMSACISEFMKTYRKKKFDIDAELDAQVDVLREIIEKLIKKQKEIVPLGLKILILGEKEKEKTKKESQALIVKKLLVNQEIVDIISNIVS